MEYLPFHDHAWFADHFVPPPVPSSSTNVAPASSVQDAYSATNVDASRGGCHSPAPSGSMPATVPPSAQCNGNSPQTVPLTLVEPAPKHGWGRRCKSAAHGTGTVIPSATALVKPARKCALYVKNVIFARRINLFIFIPSMLQALLLCVYEYCHILHKSYIFHTGFCQKGEFMQLGRSIALSLAAVSPC